MRIFISWSGERSRQVGLALRDWLPLALHFVKPWLSATDIDAGQRWATEVGAQLNDSSFGILCLTRDNLQSPWMLFEAGALAKSVTAGAVVPYLLDIDFSEITGPLAQFQGKKADESSTFDLVKAINNRALEPVPNERLADLFELLWPRLKEMLSRTPQTTATAQPLRQQREILEELVQVVRAVEQRTRVLDTVFEVSSGVDTDAAPSANATSDWRARAADLLYVGNFVAAAKAVREGTGMGLIEAKKVIDSWKPQFKEVRSQLHQNNKINAIEALRKIPELGFGIKQAKDLVDAWQARPAVE
jgi:ribosomal protein L7/L12